MSDLAERYQLMTTIKWSMVATQFYCADLVGSVNIWSPLDVSLWDVFSCRLVAKYEGKKIADPVCGSDYAEMVAQLGGII